jgi:peptide/nickel transport system permease protein
MFWQEDKSGFTTAAAWKEMKRSRTVTAGFWITVLLILLAAFCYVLAPDPTQFANRKSLSIGNQPPGFEVTMLRVVDNKPADPQGFFSRHFYGVRPADTYVPISSSRYEGTDIIVREFSASGDSSFESKFNIADVVYPVNHQKEIVERNGGLFFETADGVATGESINDMQKFIDGQYLVQKKFILGTDRYGRDVLSRLLVSTRATVFNALLATLVALVAGFILGFGAGISRGRTNAFIVWFTNSVWSFPALFVIAALLFVLGNGAWSVILVTGCVLWVEVARLVYLRITEGKKKKFTMAARALGIPKWQIIKRYVLQEVAMPLLASAATVLCAAVIIESGINFLGIGIQSPAPSWGAMIRENFRYMIVPGCAYLTIVPGLALTAVSFAFVFLSSGLRASLKEDYNISIA